MTIRLFAIPLMLSAAPALSQTVYVSNERGNSVTVIDGKTMKPIATWPVGKRPRGIMLSKDGKHLYLCASDDHAVQIVDIATGKVLHDLPAGDDP